MSRSFNFDEFERQEAAREEHADAKWALEQQKKAQEGADAFLWALIQTGELKTLAALLKPKNGSR